MEIEKPLDFTPFSDNDLDDLLRILLKKNAFHQTNDHRFIETLQPIPKEEAKIVIMLHKLYADKMIDSSGYSSQKDYKYLKEGHRGNDSIYTLEYTRRWKEFTTNGGFILTPKGYNCIVSGGYVSKTKNKKIKKRKETWLFISAIITAIATALTALFVIILPSPTNNNQNSNPSKSNMNHLDTIIKKIEKDTVHFKKKLP